MYPLFFSPILLSLFHLVLISFERFIALKYSFQYHAILTAEQISREAAEKFLKEKKAWKTTSKIIGFVILSFLPSVVLVFWRLSGFALGARLVFQPLIYHLLMINSLANPMVYCWRCEDIRKVMIALIRRQK